jgi:hypothetical protein
LLHGKTPQNVPAMLLMGRWAFCWGFKLLHQQSHTCREQESGKPRILVFLHEIYLYNISLFQKDSRACERDLIKVESHAVQLSFLPFFGMNLFVC